MSRFFKFTLIIAAIVVITAGCVSVQHEYDLVSNIKDGESLPPKSIVEVKLQDALTGEYVESALKVVKDDETVLEDTGVEHVFVADEEGFYTVSVSSVDGKSTKTLTFKVSALEREVYLDGGTIYYDYNIPAMSESDDLLYMRFCMYEEEPVSEESDEVYSERKRLNLLDTDGDGVYDQWEVLPAASSTEQQWCAVDYAFEAYDTTWTLYFIEYREDQIMLWYLGITGPYKGYLMNSEFAEVGFELNRRYSRYLWNYSSDEYTYQQFILHERYNSDTKPEFYLEASTNTIALGDEVKVYVRADNVADFAKLYDVRYAQITVKHSDNLELSDVSFGNFMEGLKDVGNYNSNETSVVLYRAFLNGEDETADPTTTFAVLTFRVTEDATEDASVELVYEGWWDTYGDYPDLPNPIFKDSNNSNVDGFVLNHEPVELELLAADTAD